MLLFQTKIVKGLWQDFYRVEQDVTCSTEHEAFDDVIFALSVFYKQCKVFRNGCTNFIKIFFKQTFHKKFLKRLVFVWTEVFYKEEAKC